MHFHNSQAGEARSFKERGGSNSKCIKIIDIPLIGWNALFSSFGFFSSGLKVYRCLFVREVCQNVLFLSVSESKGLIKVHYNFGSNFTPPEARIYLFIQIS